MRVAHWLAAGLLAWPLAALPQVGDSPLTLAGAQDLAETRSHSLDALTAAAAAAAERAVAAAQRPDPVLRIGLDNVPVEGDGAHRLTREPMTARSIGLTQAWPDAAKRAARAAQFDREADAAWARRTLQRRSLRLEAAQAWWDLHALERVLAVLQARQTEAALLQDAAEAAYRAGRGAQVEVFAARAAQAQLHDETLALQAQRDDARERLRRWVGDAAGQSLSDAPPLDADPLPGADATADPALISAQSRTEAAEAAVQVAREERRADWSVDLRFAQRGPRYDNMFTLGLSIPLRWNQVDLQDRELAARLALRQQAEADAEEVRRQRDADVARWRLAWRSGLDRLHWLAQTRQPLAQARTNAALAAYRASQGTLQTVLEARRAALDLDLERIRLERDTAGHWLQLATLIPPTENAR
jgi:outer membrane protein TolC